MEKSENVRSTIKPEPMVVDEYHTYVRENIREVQVPCKFDDDDGHLEYEFEETIYENQEYIVLLSDKNKQREELSNIMELALCELYEASLQV